MSWMLKIQFYSIVKLALHTEQLFFSNLQVYKINIGDLAEAKWPAVKKQKQPKRKWLTKNKNRDKKTTLLSQPVIFCAACDWKAICVIILIFIDKKRYYTDNFYIKMAFIDFKDIYI